MKQALALILSVAMIAGAGAAWAQQAPATPQPQQPQMGPMMGPGMMCPCMKMRMQQLTPEQQKQMQGWWQGCPMWQMTPQQPPSQPEPKK
jgi:hypothetical protein